jgi:ribose transport system permease protein
MTDLTVDSRPLSSTAARTLREATGHSAVIAGALLVALALAGLVAVDGFGSTLSIKSMLLFAGFLGIASVGQTLCALLGGLDLSIPFVMGAANIGTLWLIGKGLSSGAAIVVVMALAALIGALTGVISHLRPGQSLLVSLGAGFAVLGAAQIVTSVGSAQAGTVYGQVPQWLVETASVNAKTAGIGIPPAVVIWIAVAVGIGLLLRATWFGRGLYAMGGNRTAAARVLVPQLRIWITAFAVSAAMAAVAGILLLGFSGGAFADVGQPYLFTTVTAVVIGGTSLLGGRGSYGLTVLGVAVLTVLSTLLVGLGLSTPAQQAVLGLLIIPMVALYGREAHPGTQI